MAAAESALAPALWEMVMASETLSGYHSRRAREERAEASLHLGEEIARRHNLLAIGHEALADEFA
jgi:hypothetical protein